MSELYSKGYKLADYDKMSIEGKTIHTNNFTENMQEFEEVNSKHPFALYLLGFSHNLLEVDITKIHGWFHKKTKQAKFFAGYPYDTDTLICIAWSKYCKAIAPIEGICKDTMNNVQVSIYRSYCGELYKSNEYETCEKMFYARFANKIITHLATIE